MASRIGRRGSKVSTAFSRELQMKLKFALTFAAILLANSLARAADVPRYNLSPGRVLVYSLHIENNTEKSVVVYEGRWEFTVLKHNEDGSFRVAAIKAMAQTSTAGGQ